MWKQEFEPRGPQGPDDRESQAANLGRLIAVAVAAAAALAFASLMPGPLVAPVMRDLLLVSAFGAVAAAALRREPLFAPAVTAWDQAALLLLLSLLLGFCVDPAAVAETLRDLDAGIAAGINAGIDPGVDPGHAPEIPVAAGGAPA